MTEEVLPNFTFSPEDIANIKESLGVAEVAEDATPPEELPQPIRRKRGRPRKHPLPETRTAEVKTEPTSPDFKSPVVPLTKREEREVAERLANILGGLTGMGGIVKPYVPMTDEEAKAIAEPLASYLIRNEPTSGVAREILENYDIVAMVLGVGAYGVRVYGDRRAELAANKPANTTTLQRISERKESNNGREPDEGTGANVSLPFASVSGPTPYDV